MSYYEMVMKIHELPVECARENLAAGDPLLARQVLHLSTALLEYLEVECWDGDHESAALHREMRDFIVPSLYSLKIQLAYFEIDTPRAQVETTGTEIPQTHPPTQKHKKLVDTAEAARILGIDRSTLDEMVHNAPKNIPGGPIRVGQGKKRFHLRWDPETVVAWAKEVRQRRNSRR